MKINKTVLKTALEQVKPGLANKEIIEQSNSFVFIEDRVLTYNDEISISYPLSIGITGAIKATELYNLLGKVKKEEISIEVEENQLVLTCGRTKAGIIFQNEVKIPISELSNIPSLKWKSLDSIVLEALSFVQDCCSTDASRPILTGACITSNKITASDGFRIAEWQVKTPFKEGVIIPKTSIGEIIKFQPTKTAISDGWVHFMNENNAILSCRTIEGNHPNTDKIWIQEGKFIEFPEVITESIERVRIFSKKDFILDEEILVESNGGKLHLKASSDNGWIEEKLALKTEVPDFQFSITPMLFDYILKFTKSCLLSGNKIQFNVNDWKYVAILKKCNE